MLTCPASRKVSHAARAAARCCPTSRSRSRRAMPRPSWGRPAAARARCSTSSARSSRRSSGTVTLDGRDPFALSARSSPRSATRQIGFVFQDHCLLPQCTVLENVLVPTLVAGARAGGRGRRRRAGARPDRAGRPRRADRPSARRAVRRRAAARRDRARADPAAAAAALRRAHRQPRSRRRRDGRVAAARSPPARRTS